MKELFTRHSPGALTLRQAIEKVQNDAREQRAQCQKASRSAQQLARQGRGGDTEIAHVARGEIVVPGVMQSPEVIALLRRAAAANGIRFESLSVGNARNHINPNTGAPEFALDSDEGIDEGQVTDTDTDGMSIDPTPLQVPPELQGQWDQNQSSFDKNIANNVHGIGKKMWWRSGALDQLAIPEVQAGLAVIRHAEGGAPGVWTGGDPYPRSSEHPGYNPNNHGQSAAGPYQQQIKPWNDSQGDYGQMNFSDPTDDALSALHQIHGVKAGDDLQMGDFDQFLGKVSGQGGWAALPPNGSSQRMTMDQARQLYNNYLNQFRASKSVKY